MSIKNLSLIQIQPTIRHFAQMLSQVLQLEVEIVDNELIRVAGSGPYSQQIGQRTANAQRLGPIITAGEQRSRHQLSGAQSGEQAFLGLPIMYDDHCLGVICLVAVNGGQQQQLQDNIQVFSDYVGHICTLLVANLLKTKPITEGMDQLFTTLINSMDQGILVFDDAGVVKFANKTALKRLNTHWDALLETPLTLRPLVTNKDFANGNAQHVISFANQQEIVIGQHHTGDGLQLFLFAFHQSERSEDPITDATEEPTIGQFIGNAPSIKALRQLVARFADSPSSIMITGESGSGKEVLARSIHQLGERNNQPFIAINCAAIPEHLLESELFGYVKGAFTGASPRGKTGLIQAANNGTLFLDEIGDMPLPLQAKLLRVLEAREVLPLGASAAVPVDIRIISATHQNLQQAIAEGAFREDLYYRLKVIPVEIPPLRQRTEDIELLVHYFLNMHTRRMGITYPGISSEVLTLLRQYRWPGNVRELSNLVEYLINIVPDGEVIDTALLPPQFHSHNAHSANHATTALASGVISNAATPNLKKLEHQLIAEALQRGDSKAKLAQDLDISMATLYRKIKKYGLS